MQDVMPCNHFAVTSVCNNTVHNGEFIESIIKDKLNIFGDYMFNLKSLCIMVS